MSVVGASDGASGGASGEASIGLLIGRDLSPFVRRSATVLNLLGLSYERKRVATEEDGDFIREHNPLGRVPALIVTAQAGADGYVIVDSAMIIDYALEIATNGHSLLASAGVQRRNVLYLSALATGVMEKIVAAAYEVRMRPKEYVYSPYLERLQGQAIAGLVELNSRVNQPYFGGDVPCLADVNAVIAYDQMKIVAPEILKQTALPGLSTLSERANQLAAFAATRWQPEAA